MSAQPSSLAPMPNQNAMELLPLVENGAPKAAGETGTRKGKPGKDAEGGPAGRTAPGHAKTFHTMFDQYVREGDLSSMLIEWEKAKHNPERQRRMICVPDGDKLTSLHYAARYGHLHVIEFLLNHGADVNAKGENSMTPLHFAARYSAVSAAERSRTRIAYSFTVEEPEVLCSLDSFFHRKGGHSDPVVFCLIEKGAEVNACDEYGLTPLHYAVMRGNTLAATELMDAKCDIEIRDNNNMTALHTAAAHGSVEAVRNLLRAGANVLGVDSRRNTPLHLAAKNGHLDVVRVIVEETNEHVRARLVNTKNNEEDTVLHLAVDANCIEIVELLQAMGCDVNERRGSENTALHSAASKGYCEMVEKLLQMDADLRAVNDRKDTPLHNAAAFNKAAVVSFLTQPSLLLSLKPVLNAISECNVVPEQQLQLARGMILEAENKDGCTPFLVAVFEGHVDAVKALHSGGANIFVVDHQDRNCIYIAAQFNCRSTLQYLLEEVCPKSYAGTCPKSYQDLKYEFVNARNRYSEAPMHVAAANGFLEICELLFKHGADRGPLNENEETPMHHAARRGKTAVVKKFLEWHSKAIVDKDDASNTPLHLAAREGHAHAVKALVDAGADIMARNAFEETALDCAVKHGRLLALEVLLDNGAPAEPASSVRTTTPLHIAAKAGHPEIIKALLKKAATIDRPDGDGRTCLDIAIDHEYKLCCLAILQHPRWRHVMRASANQLGDNNGESPLRLLIKRLPEVVELVFNNSMRKFGKHEDEDFHIVCDYEFLDDSFILRKSQTEKSEDTETETSTKGDCLLFPYDAKGKLQPKAQLYTTDYDAIMANHPLRVIVESQRAQLLSHPLVSYLLRHKWNSTCRYIYYTGLMVYIVFLLLLTSFVVAQPAPFNVPNIIESGRDYREVLSNATLCSSLGITKRNFGLINMAPWPIIFLAIVQLLKEAYQFRQRRSRYVNLENAFEVSVYAMSIPVVLDFTSCSEITGLRMEWQWILAGFCVFFAWINLLIMIRKLPKFGIYVVMFIDVLKTFAQFFIVFVLFVVAFSLLFFIWLQNKPEFGHVWWSLLKTTMMMIGEMDFVSMFFDGDKHENIVFTAPWLNILLLCFVIIMTILLMNLLVGLAVDDIKAVQEKAELTRLAMQVDLVLDVERTLHGSLLSRVRRWTALGRQKIYPNKVTWLKSVRRRFGGTSAARALTAEMVGDEQDMYTKLKSDQEETMAELSTLKRYIEDVSMQQERQRQMLTAILEGMQILYEDRDDLENPLLQQ